MDFDVFYQKYYWNVCGYFTRKGMLRHDAEELTQEVFLYCYNHFSDYDPKRSTITTWLYVIATSRFKNYCRDQKTSLILSDIIDIADDHNAIECAIEIDELRSRLADALKELPETQRKIVILRHFIGMSTEDAAQKLEISAGNARVILSRALKALRIICHSAIEGECIDG